jgi:hypothetical protein
MLTRVAEYPIPGETLELYVVQMTNHIPNDKQLPFYHALLCLFKRELQTLILTWTFQLGRRITDRTVGFHIHCEGLSSCDALTHPQARV